MNTSLGLRMTRPFTDRIAALIEPVLAEMDVELVDVEYLTERGRRILRIYVDTAGGVTVEQCARVSREIGDLVDVKDLVPQQFVLEVSSPGLNRPLKRDKDFQWAVGRRVKVRARAAVQGQRNFDGVLERFDQSTLHLRLGERLVPVALENLEKANLVYEFDE